MDALEALALPTELLIDGFATLVAVERHTERVLPPFVSDTTMHAIREALRAEAACIADIILLRLA